jgi:ABC-2 type transport system permease protein/oleandomycin transport system permease protein
MTTYAASSVDKTASSGFAWMLGDIWEMTKRNLIRYTRRPQLIVFSTIQPVMFVLLFVYVFGGAIQTPGMDYVNYLMPAIFIQTVLFGTIQTGVGLSEDMSKGLIDRFRSLPMARSAVLAGRTLADLTRNVFVIAIMLVVGYLVGFRVQTDVLSAMGGVGLALVFSFAIMWIMATIGLITKDAETTQTMAMVTIFPLVFASSAFVPVETMPGWLQAFAEISPVTVTIDAIRGLMVTGEYTPALWKSLAWIGGVLIVFAPLAVRRYRRAS